MLSADLAASSVDRQCGIAADPHHPISAVGGPDQCWAQQRLQHVDHPQQQQQQQHHHHVKTGGQKIAEYQLGLLLKAAGLLTAVCIPSGSGSAHKTVSVRSSHNESERDRRAHLRRCIEQVKLALSMSNSTNESLAGSAANGRTRITTLNVLKEAMRQILTSRQKNRQIRQIQLKLESDLKALQESNRKYHREISVLKMRLKRSCCSGSECSNATTVSDAGSQGDISEVVKSSTSSVFHRRKSNQTSNFFTNIKKNGFSNRRNYSNRSQSNLYSS